MICKGRGEVDRLVFRGRKPCWNCDGTGIQADLEDAYYEAKAGVREYREGREREHDWGPDFEDGGWVPGGAAEDWAHGDGLDWDGM